jgi:ribosomal 50S subunit-associated protein YjgA (DUF615 family)
MARANPQSQTSELAEKLDVLIRHAEARQQATEQVLAQLQALGEALPDQLAEALHQAGGNLPNRLAKALSQTPLHLAETADQEDLQAIGQTLATQTDILQSIRSHVATSAETANRNSQALEQLTAAIETAQSANASHVALMEQLRDHLTRENDMLTETYVREHQALRRVIYPVIALLGVLVLLALFGLIVG